MVSEVLGNSTSLNIINIINIITSDVTPSLNSFQIQVSENIWLSRYLDIHLHNLSSHIYHELTKRETYQAIYIKAFRHVCTFDTGTLLILILDATYSRKLKDKQWWLC